MNLTLINKIENIIDSYQDDDYIQILETILYCIPEEEYEKFYKMLSDADSNEKQLVIIDSELNKVNWDRFDLSFVKLK